MSAFLRAVPFVLVAAVAAAQEPAPAPAPDTRKPQAAPAPAPGLRWEPSVANVRIDLTLTEQTGSRPSVKKTMTLTLADGDRGSIRSKQAVTDDGGWRSVPLNLDAMPQIMGGRIKLRLILEYTSMGESPAEGRSPNADVNFSGHVFLENGRPMAVAEAADPVSDRRVTVEVKATVLK